MVFLQDLRWGIRRLLKSAGFTAAAVLTLAVGIGMTTSIFSVVYGVLLRPLDYARPDRIVELLEINAQGHHMHFADQNFDDVHSQVRSLDGVAEYATWPEAVSGGTEPTRTAVAVVSRDFFPILRVHPVRGRGFRPEDHRFGASPVALVAYGYWKQYLDGSSDLSTRKLVIENRAFSIAGVLPPGFSFPAGAEIWIPRELYEPIPSRTAHNWVLLGRLRDGSSLTGARAELQTLAARLKRQYGPDTMMTGVSIVPLRDAMTSNVRPALWVLLGAVTLLLLIACANVANLLMVQLSGRRHEIALRFALGATRRRVVGQLMAEMLLLAATGGALGVLAAFWGLHALLALSPGVLPRVGGVSISAPVLLFSIGLSVAVAIALGVFGGVRSSSGLQHALAGGRSQTGAVLSQRVSRALVAGQLAVTLTLLTGAALLGRSLLRVLSVDPGFRTERVVTMNLALPAIDQDAARARRVEYLDALLTRMRAIPGVEAVGGTGNLPLTGFHPDGTYIAMAPGEQVPQNEQALEPMWHDRTRTGDAEYASVSAGYFKVLGIPLLRGRLFDERDTMDAPHVAIVSQSLANEKWRGQDPLGRVIEFGNMDGDLRPLTVVGVVGDVRADALEQRAFPTVYVSYRQLPQRTEAFNVVALGGGDPAALIGAARRIARDLDPDVPPVFATMDQLVSGSIQPRRFNLFLVGVFAGTALLLAIAGMYGVMAYSVSRRTNEIGVRMAMGASRTSILRLVLGQGLVTALAGVAAGVAGSLAATRAIASLLYGLSPADPATLTGAALLLTVVGLVASYVPARRATKVDPLVALRYE